MEFRTMTIVYKEEDEDWCQFVMRKIPSQLNLNIHTLNVSTLKSSKDPPELETAVRESYVTFLLMTSHFLDYMETYYDWLSLMLKKRDYELNTIVAAQLHLSDDDLKDVATKYNYDYENWEMMEIDISGKNMEDIISKTLGIYDQNHEQRMLRSPRQMQRRPSAPVVTSDVQLIPSTVQGPGEKVAVLFTEELKGSVTLDIVDVTQPIQCCPVNPYCVIFTTPELQRESNRVQVNINGKRKARLNLTKKALVPQFQGIELMLETYKVGTREELDKKLAETVKASISDARVMSIFDEFSDASSTSSSSAAQDCMYPTLFHWAAAHGMTELCSALTSVPGAAAACNINNCEGCDPSDMARKHGHMSLADFIWDFTDTKLMADQVELYVKTIPRPMKTDEEEEESYYVEVNPGQSPASSVAASVAPPLPARQRGTSTSSAMSDDVFQGAGYETAGAILPPCTGGARSQAELVDIQEGVKKGDFTKDDAVMLFHSWQSRYQSGNAMSFKEKQRSLQSLRDEFQKKLKPLGNIKEGKNKKKKSSEQIESLSDISEPTGMRRMHWEMTPPHSGRGSKTSIGSSGSFDANRDSGVDDGRLSTLSNVSSASELSEQDEQGLLRRNRTRSDRSSNRSLESRKSVKDLYLQLKQSVIEFPDIDPPPLPPRRAEPPTPAAKPTRVFSRQPQPHPSVEGKKPAILPKKSPNR